MSNTRKAGRKQKNLGLKEQNRRLVAMVQEAKERLEAQSAVLESVNRQRPDDLEDWINEIALPDLSPEERAEWDAMTDAERERFTDALGERINVTKALIEAGDGGLANPPASETAESL